MQNLMQDAHRGRGRLMQMIEALAGDLAFEAAADIVR